ncbi:hypothetical protein [Polynucleobacter sinensis]|uniref:hypothetical protein n=1 Tax=Polynucleobacter sinensis TaxID=1743157 RepID=UPI0012E88B5D|nr:hypothetical protein [Polynucleobacter sinensis]
MNKQYPKRLKTISAIFILFSMLGCDQLTGESTILKNKWVFSERIDKITNSKTILVTARLMDEQYPTKYVDTSIVCEGEEDAYIEFVLHTKGDKTDAQSIITKEKDVSYLRMRSGESQFAKLAMGEFSNQAIVPFSGLDGYAGLTTLFLGGSTNPLAVELKSPELHVEIPSKFGSPVVLIKFNDPNILKLLEECKISPAFQKQ